MDAVNTTAKFEVRSFTRSWDNRGYSKNLSIPWIRPRSLFSQSLGTFVHMDAMNTPAKFEACSFTRSWDNRGYSKIGQSLDSPTLPILRKFKWAFVRMVPVNVAAKVRSFTWSWDNRVLQKFCSLWIQPRSLFSKFLRGFRSDGPCECRGQI